LLTACSKLVDNLGQAVQTQLVDGLLADLLEITLTFDDQYRRNKASTYLGMGFLLELVLPL
jgi:hypothetical protein